MAQTKVKLAQIDAEIINGWLKSAVDWTRTGNHTFTTSGDTTSVYQKGTRIRYKQGGSYEYGVVASSSHAAGTTTVNLVPNTDFEMAASTVTDNYFSYMQTPVGYPTWFAYTPTWGGVSTPSGAITRFKIDGTAVTVFLWMPNVATGTATTFNMTGPVTSANISNSLWITRLGYAEDNGSASTGLDYARIGNNSAQIDFYRSSGSSNWTNSTQRRVGVTHTYEF